MNPKHSNDARQAVVIIHGIGEQEPMQTLRGFAESIIPDVVDDPMGYKEKFYVKPDELSQLFDLRRITVPQDKAKTRIKTDFYEYYWAHQIRNTDISDVISWGSQIFLRWKYVPKRLRVLHTVILLLAVLILVSGISLIILVPGLKDSWAGLLAAGAGSVYLAFKWISSIVKSISVNFIGDAARYLTPKPGNIINRQQIRKEGLELFRKLHGETGPNSPRTPRYTRIIVVAHSLGSVIAYDLLSSLWGSYHDEFNKKSDVHQAKLLEMQALVKTISNRAGAPHLTEEERRSFQQLQSELLEASIEAGNPWRVSDFITIGSPLSHAQLLLAKGLEDLHELQQERLFSTCPPTLEAQGTFSYTETYDFDTMPAAKMKIPHHAALFALTRWTNGWFKNDYVGGPMQESFGIGIKDIEMTSKTHEQIPFLSHTFYWDKRETESVEMIRNIIFKPIIK